MVAICYSVFAAGVVAASEEDDYNCMTKEMWSETKQQWCCEHKSIGCRAEIQFEPDPYNCMTKEMWSETKQKWCCEHKSIGCHDEIQFKADPYNCMTLEVWTEDKKAWCCEEKHLGCQGEVNMVGQCPVDEEWRECGTACQTHCGSQPSEPCTQQCVAQCECKPGYVRPSTADGTADLTQCIKATECPAAELETAQKCAANEEWRDCGSACQTHCGSQPFEPCTQQCVAQCECMPGYVRPSTADGTADLTQCIKATECPAAELEAAQKCPANEEWQDCGSACQTHCGSQPSDPCTMQCVAQCQCKQGYVRPSTADGNAADLTESCIEATECPAAVEV